MCGIGGIQRVWPVGERDRALATPPTVAIPERWLDTLDDSIRHRGPDGQGRFRDRTIRADGCVVDVAFVHRRLSIIDHDSGGQPMVSPGRGRGAFTGTKRWISSPGLGLYERDVIELGTWTPSDVAGEEVVAVVFNGCIYNHRALRAELRHAGHVFTTDHSDTEVLVHGWREWGDALATRLDGMVAAALWSRSAGLTTLLRDRAGEKPLHVATLKMGESELTMFASTAAGTLRALSAAGATCAQHRCAAHLPSWLRFGFGPQAPSEYCSQVQPSHTMTIDRHPLRNLPYGVVPTLPEPSVPPRTVPLGVQELDAMIQQAVASRLEADVPIGCFLSGGIDSAVVAAAARRRLGRLRTFTVRMPDDRYDESKAAAITARHIGTDHSVLECAARPALDLSALIEQIGLPLGDSSLLPTYWLSRATAEAVDVSLSGDGGDELFVGYERHTAARALSSVWRPLLSVGALLGSGHDPKSSLSKFSRLGRAAIHGGYAELLSIFPSTMLGRLGAGRALGPPREWNNGGIAGALQIDRWLYLPSDLMAKSDAASMSVALEVRAPLLAAALVDRATNAPLHDLTPLGRRKGLFRQVARKYLPDAIVDRPKMGFAIPIGEWFRTDYGGLRTMLLDHLHSAEPFGPPSLGIDLNQAYIRQMLDDHLGGGPSGVVRGDHSQRLYMLLVLSIWAKWLGSLGSG